MHMLTSRPCNYIVKFTKSSKFYRFLCIMGKLDTKGIEYVLKIYINSNAADKRQRSAYNISLQTSTLHTL